MATNRPANDVRKEYSGVELDVLSVSNDPLDQFRTWYEEATAAEDQEANAMSVSTVGADGAPSSRIVLLKEFNERGFVFYSNYHSQKGRELLNNGKSCLLFWWPKLARQIRIAGRITKGSSSDADSYFSSRPRGSQLGAAASPQSSRVDSRDGLLDKFRDVSRQYENKDVQRPEHWGGFVLIPHRFEFWQGQQNRLHDRIGYEMNEAGEWETYRLAP